MDDNMKLLLVKTSLAIAAADSLHTLMMEVEAGLNEIGRGLKREEKRKLNLLKQSAKDFKIRLSDIAKDGYKISCADNFCDDADWIKDFLMLLVDRVGDNDDKMVKARALIYNMKSELNIL